MHVEQLIKMANQIGSFFEAMPDRAQALEDAAQHIKKFWEPRMRRELLAHLDSVGNGELNETMAQALSRHRAMLS
ncbi:formate dehydrogenase subunit delta [Ramlibacter sp. WS9]|uniref:formate dehydrogenase subunit delta n=1 Tax=Ramlibacter sp. WS9 TaxID=1882741 RepID=UPI0011442BFB|nr:formate dehydrogenase subunit delta [Ramlibacter sp. WS9]ROZ76584.1 formate dehydrogenase [Ramlibacter sp. WS9]